MLPVKSRDEIDILTVYIGVPEKLSKIRDRVTSVVAVLAYQSTHVIYHIKDN